MLKVTLEPNALQNAILLTDEVIAGGHEGCEFYATLESVSFDNTIHIPPVKVSVQNGLLVKDDGLLVDFFHFKDVEDTFSSGNKVYLFKTLNSARLARVHMNNIAEGILMYKVDEISKFADDLKYQIYVYAYFFDPKTELWVDIKSQLFTDELGIDYDHPALLKADTRNEGYCNYSDLVCQYEQEYSKYLLAKSSPKLMQEFIYGYKLKPTWVAAKVETAFSVGDKFLDVKGDEFEVVSRRVIPYVDNLVYTFDTPVAMFCEDGVVYSLKSLKGETMQGSTKHMQEMVKVENEVVAELVTIRYYRRCNGELIMQINAHSKVHNMVVHEGVMQNEVEHLLNKLSQVEANLMPNGSDLSRLTIFN